jgi:thiaminase/transcriptional activator TenA
VAALLPCYWIYWEVGKALARQGSPDPLYQRWIDTYGAEEFGALVQAVLALTDQLAASLPDAARQAMQAHFVTTSRYEWLFWEMGYRRETWPV